MSRGGPETWSAERRRLAAELLRRRGLAGKGGGAPEGGNDADTADAGRRRTPVPGEDEGPAPLTFNQEGLWAIDRLHPGQASFSVPGALRLRGPLNVAELEAALGRIVRRQDVLRTTFREIDGAPRQVVAPPGEWTLPVEDLTSRPEAEREPAAYEALTEEALRPFDLERGPLFRARLLRLAEDDHVLSVNFHHAVADGWAMGVFIDELAAFCESPDSEAVPPLPTTFGEFAREERRRMRGETLERLLRYWRERLDPPLPVLRLPTDRPRPAVQSFRGRHAPVEIPADLAAAVRRLARDEGASVYMILLAAFQVLLHGLTGQRDLIVGSTFANRDRGEVDRLIGFTANTMPLRTSLEGEPAFRELVGRVRETVLGAYDHQELPFAKLLQHVPVERSSNRNPVFQVVFDLLTLDRNPAIFGYGLASRVKESRRIGRATASPMDVEGAVARFDIAVFLWDTPSGLCGTFEYNTDLFDEATMTRIVGDFVSLVRRVVAEPGIGVAEAAREIAGGADASPTVRKRGTFRGAARKAIRLEEQA